MMAELRTENEVVNVLETDKLSSDEHPTHFAGDCAKISAVKHPPNGMTHISPDSNGLIKDHELHIKGCIGTEKRSAEDEIVASPADESCTSLDSLGDICDCNKSSSVDICELESSLHGVYVADTDPAEKDIYNGIEYVVYRSELQMPDIMRLITKDLSEPYSIYTYRYFIHNWPKLCFLAMDGDKCVGAIVCKLDLHKKMVRRGYIAMLAVDSEYRRKKIGSHLVLKAIRAMIADDCDEVVLETEITNQAALRLYENLGFVRDKRLFRYYLNGVDALRLKLWLR